MARQVEWTEPAWADLSEIADYIANDSQYYAEFAGRGQIVPEFDDPSVRELLIKSYRLVYRISEERVRVLALIHGARRRWRV